MREWELLSQQAGLSGFVKGVARLYRMPDGTTQTWDILESGPTVAILAVTRHVEVVLVRQYRPGPAQVLLEMPGGFVEDGETVLEAAGRELLEETGFRGVLEEAGSCWLSARDTRRAHVVIAREAELVAEPTPDSGEFCEPLLVSVVEFRSRLRQGQLTDVALGYLGLDHLDLL